MTVSLRFPPHGHLRAQTIRRGLFNSSRTDGTLTNSERSERTYNVTVFDFALL
jgi:hypothetical protein